MLTLCSKLSELCYLAMEDELNSSYQVIDFCCGHPFTHKRSIVEWILEFQSVGRESKLFSVSGLKKDWQIYADYWDKNLDSNQLVKVDRVFRKKEYQARIKGKKALMVFLFPPFSHKSRKIWRRFRSLGYETAFLGLGPLPIRNSESKNNWFIQLKNFFKFRFKIFFFTAPDVWITSGDQPYTLYKSALLEKKSARFVHAHSFDFENIRCQGFLQADHKTSENFIVYLDQGFTSHPDQHLNPHGGPLTVEGVYRPILNFLTQLEKNFDYPLKIAGHPKADRDQTEKIFVNRDIEYGRTLELISDARVVVCHSSTAIQWAVLMNKPIIIVSTAQLEKTKLNSKARGIAQALNLEVVDVNSHALFERIVEPTYDSEAYKRYVRDFIKSDRSLDIPLKEILISNL